MTRADDITFSRPLGVARALGAAGLSEDNVLAKTVILTGEQAALNTANGRWCFLNSLRLLCRNVGPLSVVLPRGVPGFEQEVRRLASGLWSRCGVTVLPESAPLHANSAAAVLNIGFGANRDARWTTINSNGWVTRVSSEPLALLPSDMQQDNPLAAMLAASRNAVALLLSQLPVGGRLHIVDKQAFGHENLGTPACCSTPPPGPVGIEEGAAVDLRGNDLRAGLLEELGR